MVERNKVVGYELLGVLIPPLPELETAWRDMNAVQRKTYRKRLLEFMGGAKPIFKPAGEFVVITGLRQSEPMQAALANWLDMKFRGQWENFCMLDKPRTHDNMLAFKATWIERLGVTEYWEPDPSLVKELSRLCPHTVVRWSFSLPREKQNA